jgi:hypothetical protein
MGLFDTYIPDPPLSCPVCGTLIERWQGYDADCLLFTWKQGQRHPIRHDWPEECVEDEQQFLQSHTLPASFAFYAWDCKCDRQPLAAYGFCEDGVWVRSEFVTHLNWRPGPQNSVRDEHKIKRDLETWLKSWVT